MLSFLLGAYYARDIFKPLSCEDSHVTTCAKFASRLNTDSVEHGYFRLRLRKESSRCWLKTLRRLVNGDKTRNLNVGGEDITQVKAVISA